MAVTQQKTEVDRIGLENKIIHLTSLAVSIIFKITRHRAVIEIVEIDAINLPEYAIICSI